MDNQHRKITGYRELSEVEIEMMNAAKALSEQVGEFVKLVECIENVDRRWCAEGKTDLQKGFMSLIRSIARPTTF